MNQYQDLSKFSVPPNFRGKPGWFVQLWWLAEALLIGPSPQFMYGWRRAILKFFGAKVGKNVLYRPSARCTYPWKLELGDNCWIGDDVVLYSLDKITIGRHAVVSQRSYICAGYHEHDQIDFPVKAKPIVIGDEAWLATNVFVAPGVNIGYGAVVGANSSVFKSLEGGYIYRGSPAVLVRKRETKSVK